MKNVRNSRRGETGKRKMDFKRERNCGSEQEVEKKIHVNERTGKVYKSTGESRAKRQNQRTGKEKEEKVFLIQT